MRTTAMAAVLVLTGAMAYGKSGDAERNVTVCMEDGAKMNDAPRARMLATEMFGRIGVTVKWQLSLHNCPAQGILVTLSQATPADLRPGALAYALPYEGAHIRLFYDRIVNYREPILVPRLVAHVLVHEITHILEGISRHSDSGIMKARWAYTDFATMIRKSLEFDQHDIGLIYAGFAARAKRAALATHDEPTVLAAR